MTKPLTKITGLFLSAALGSVAFVTPPAIAQAASNSGPQTRTPQCGPLSAIARELKQYGEVPALILQAEAGAYMFYATPPGAKTMKGEDMDSWTLVQSPDIKQPMACKVLMGTHFHLVTNIKAPSLGMPISYQIPVQEQQGGQCGPGEKIINRIERVYGEVRLAYAQADQGEIEVYGVPPDSLDVFKQPVPPSYTLLTSEPNGKTCIRASGGAFAIKPGLKEQYPVDPTPGS